MSGRIRNAFNRLSRRMSSREAERVGFIIPGSPGKYRKISASTQLTTTTTSSTTIINRTQQTPSGITTDATEEMADVVAPSVAVGGWPNNKDAYELGEVIGE